MRATTRITGKDAVFEWQRQHTLGLVKQYNLTEAKAFAGADFSDGTALCALVHFMWPESIDLGTIDRSNRLDTLEKAVRIGESRGISQLLDCKELANSTSTEVDYSIIAYVSQFYRLWRMTQDQVDRPRSSTSIGLCDGCQKPLALISINALGKVYHPQCFKCTACNVKLDSKCVSIEQHPFCETCGKKQFKMDTWRKHKREKDQWWLELLQTGEEMRGKPGDEGWSREKADKMLNIKQIPNVGKLTLSDQFDHESEINRKQRSPSSSGNNTTTTDNTNANDKSSSPDPSTLENYTSSSSSSSPSPALVAPVLLPQATSDKDALDLSYTIDDAKERQAFLAFFESLPEPDILNVQSNSSSVSTPVTPPSSSPGQSRATKKLPAIPVAPDSPDLTPSLDPSSSVHHHHHHHHMSPSSKIIKQGYLSKKGDQGLVKLWQKRYFMIKADQLLYFEDMTGRERERVLGCIPLKAVQKVVANNHSNPGTFALYGDGRTWHMRAETDHEMQGWIKAINEAASIEISKEIFDSPYLPQDMSPTSVPVKEGQLDARTGVGAVLGIDRIASWKPRWIVLRDGVLSVYKKPDPQAKDKMSLYKSTLQEYSPSNSLLPQWEWMGTTSSKEPGERSRSPSTSNSMHAFQISTKTRSIALRAGSLEEMHEWLNAITKHKFVIEEIIDSISIEGDQ